MKKLLIIILLVAVVVVVFSLVGGNSDEYTREIAQFREDRHAFFQHSSGSPFVQKGLDYEPIPFFPPDPDFKVNATLDRLNKREVVTIMNSDGSTVRYLKFARAKFKLKGEPYSLLILKALGFGNQYLTAFADGTSGLSTYGGGRYLDVAIGKSDQVVLDFNKAYNPYCAYSAEYLCPLPPKENILEVAIEAGEKDPDL